MLPRRNGVKAPSRLLGNDLDREGHLDLAVEPDTHLVRAQLFDGPRGGLAPAELHAGRAPPRFGDAGGGDRAEEPAPPASPALDLDALGGQLAGGGLPPLLLPPVTDLAGAAHGL